jgi:V8-like Glu-specific endopeptidase
MMKSVAAVYTADKIASAVLVQRQWIITALHTMLDRKGVCTKSVCFDIEQPGVDPVARRTFAPDVKKSGNSVSAGFVAIPSLDICFVRLAPDRFGNFPEHYGIPIAIPSIVEPIIGLTLTIIGHPRGTWLKRSISGSLSSFVASVLGAKSDLKGSCDFELPNGFSGGAVVDQSSGKLLGITQKYSDSEDANVMLVGTSVQSISKALSLFGSGRKLLTTLGSHWRVPSTFRLLAMGTGSGGIAPPLGGGNSHSTHGPVIFVSPSTVGSTVAGSDPQTTVPQDFSGIGFLVPKHATTKAQAGKYALGTCVLVGPQWILTAHHVVDNAEVAGNFDVVFGYVGSQQGVTPAFSAAKRYGLAKDTDSILTSPDGTYSTNGHTYFQVGDWALIRLAEEVDVMFKPLVPVELSDALIGPTHFAFLVTNIAFDGVEPLFAVMHDDNMSGNSSVPVHKILNTGMPYFSHLVPSYKGCSGAPILLKTGEFVGIHVRSDASDDKATNVTFIAQSLHEKGFDFLAEKVTLGILVHP